MRIAVDLIRLAHRKQYDVAIVFSQDQDLREVAKEIKAIAQEQPRAPTGRFQSEQGIWMPTGLSPLRRREEPGAELLDAWSVLLFWGRYRVTLKGGGTLTVSRGRAQAFKQLIL